MGPRDRRADRAHRGSPTGWRLVTQSTVNGFAWDVRRVRFLHGAIDVHGALVGSGDAGGAFGVANTTTDDDRVWGGRPDGRNCFYLALTAASGSLLIDRIVLDQPGEHWAREVVVERRSADGVWRTWTSFDNLRRGRNELVLADAFDDRRILVAIAAYRDPELARTVADAITQAAYPEHLRFAICHQFDDDTEAVLTPWADDPRFRVDAVHHSESQGCCWARNRTFSLFDDEAYLLQIDAHTRFAARWDVRFIDMLESTGSELPILTTYPSRYTLAGEHEAAVVYDTDAGVQQLYVAEVRPDLTTLQHTRLPADVSRPGRSPTLAAGLIFTRGQFCRDVDYDPEIYFAGEEISLAARAFTCGYDLFHPTETLVWHLYDHDHPKHWEDHRTHNASHAVAMARLRTLFQGDSTSLGRFGLGSVRSLLEFERYAGIDLGASLRATDNVAALVAESVAESNGAVVGPDGTLTITIDRSVIDPRDDFANFTVVLFDGSGNEVHRHDIVAPDVLALSRAVVQLANTPQTAVRWAVIPVTRDGHVGEIVLRSVSGR
jgi:glycosyltransferase involved in cell wall biosynthesis